MNKRIKLTKDDCAICHESLKEERNCDECSIKSCKDCIESWFKVSNKCPQCKRLYTWGEVEYLFNLTPSQLPDNHQEVGIFDTPLHYFFDLIPEQIPVDLLSSVNSNIPFSPTNSNIPFSPTNSLSPTLSPITSLSPANSLSSASFSPANSLSPTLYSPPLSTPSLSPTSFSSPTNSPLLSPPTNSLVVSSPSAFSPV
jgi:hypothetical protein